jgi:uncharacterized protein (DUF362 family)
MQTRRQFMVASASVGAGLAAATLPIAPAAAAKVRTLKGHIVQVTDDAMTKNDRPVTAVAEQMLQRAMVELTGKKKPADAWASIVSPKDLVAVKINCLGKPCMSTTPEVVKAIIAGLKSAGVPDERIVVFDLFGSHMRMSRYKLTKDEKGIRYICNSDWGYEDAARALPSGKARLCQVLLKADKVISVPVIKDHALSGVTCALKNMAFGVVEKPGAHHRGGCDPGIANIYNLDAVKSKVALIVCDAAFMQYDGGPQCKPAARVPMNTLLLTHDPVALDKIAWEEIDARRKVKRLPLLGKKRIPTHIATAAGLGLGTDDRAKIKVVKASAKKV